MGKIKDSLKKAVLDICIKYDYKVVVMETDINHIHILLKYDTTVCVSLQFFKKSSIINVPKENAK